MVPTPIAVLSDGTRVWLDPRTRDTIVRYPCGHQRRYNAFELQLTRGRFSKTCEICAYQAPTRLDH